MRDDFARPYSGTGALGESGRLHERIQWQGLNQGQDIPLERGRIGMAVVTVPPFVFPFDARHRRAPFGPGFRRATGVIGFPA